MDTLQSFDLLANAFVEARVPWGTYDEVKAEADARQMPYNGVHLLEQHPLLRELTRQMLGIAYGVPGHLGLKTAGWCWGITVLPPDHGRILIGWRFRRVA